MRADALVAAAKLQLSGGNHTGPGTCVSCEAGQYWRGLLQDGH